jgi:hypothetical protein
MNREATKDAKKNKEGEQGVLLHREEHSVFTKSRTSIISKMSYNPH